MKKPRSIAEPAPSPPPRPPLRLLLAVALVSAGVLGFEVSLTRVFAVLPRVLRVREHHQ
ncbi:MAG: hypothetical protein ACYC7E_19680 [Armatimonadota bacterium]